MTSTNTHNKPNSSEDNGQGQWKTDIHGVKDVHWRGVTLYPHVLHIHQMLCPNGTHICYPNDLSVVFVYYENNEGDIQCEECIYFDTSGHSGGHLGGHSSGHLRIKHFLFDWRTREISVTTDLLTTMQTLLMDFPVNYLYCDITSTEVPVGIAKGLHHVKAI